MKYFEALTVAAFQNYLTRTKICINDTRNEETNKELMETILMEYLSVSLPYFLEIFFILIKSQFCCKCTDLNFRRVANLLMQLQFQLQNLYCW